MIKKNSHCFRIKCELELRYYMDTIRALKSLKSTQILYRNKWETNNLLYYWLVHHCLGLKQSRVELLSHSKTILTFETHKLAWYCLGLIQSRSSFSAITRTKLKQYEMYYFLQFFNKFWFACQIKHLIAQLSWWWYIKFVNLLSYITLPLRGYVDTFISF